jgi:NADH-quinone oxidoreductase subunit A
MGDVAQISEFGKILIFLITGIILVCLVFFLNRLIAPNKPNFEKLTSYECGEEPVGSAWLPFNPRFYVIALIFLLFEVEMVFIIPWATVFGSHYMIGYDPRWGVFSLVEMFIFLGILILGLVYVWRKGDLEWIKNKPITPTTDVNIPRSLYDQVNIEQSAYTIKEFGVETPATSTVTITITTTLPPPVRKPMFKPTFKKPDNES